jgi:hypothetical protein
MTADRKTLARAYQERPRTMGVGAVRNLTNGKLLLCAAADLPALLNRQRAQLRLDGHRTRGLQEDWNALGADAFAFEVVDTLAPADAPDYDPTADLESLLALWMDKLRPFEPAGYHPPPRPHDAAGRAVDSVDPL